MRLAANASLLSTVSSIALMGVAAAADLRLPTKAPIAPPPIWAGTYVGLNAGVAWHHWAFNDLDNQLFLLAAPAPSPVNNEFWSGNRAAFTIGGQVGHNWESGKFVYGVEADLNYVDARSDLSFVHPRFPILGVITGSTRLDWLATLRGRLGIALSPTLIYVTGGLAVAHVRDFYTFTPFPPGTEVVNDKTLVGYAVGGGGEHKLSPEWSVKVEGMYVGLEKSNVVKQRFNNTYRSEFKHSAATLRIGVNRKLP